MALLVEQEYLEVTRETEDIAVELVGRGVSVRDAGAILGVSGGRVSQYMARRSKRAAGPLRSRTTS